MKTKVTVYKEKVVSVGRGRFRKNLGTVQRRVTKWATYTRSQWVATSCRGNTASFSTREYAAEWLAREALHEQQARLSSVIMNQIRRGKRVRSSVRT